MSASLLIAALSLAIWAYLLLARGGFWRAADRDDLAASPEPAVAEAAVTAVIPARNEADVVAVPSPRFSAKDRPSTSSW